MNAGTARGVREFFERCGSPRDMAVSSKKATLREETEISESDNSNNSSSRQQLAPKKGQKRERPSSSINNMSSHVSSTSTGHHADIEPSLSSGEGSEMLLMGNNTHRSDIDPKMKTKAESSSAGRFGNSGNSSVSSTRTCSDNDGGNAVPKSTSERNTSRRLSFFSARNGEGTGTQSRRPSMGIESLQRVSSMSLEGLVGGARKMNEYRLFAGKVVNDERMQLFIVILIAINAIMLGLGTFKFVQDDETTLAIFEGIDKFFLVLFTVELGLQFLYRGWTLIKDAWLLFDLFIITLSWVFSNVQIIRAFRIFRALRLVTRIKVMKNLILAMFGVMPRMGAICLLLLLVFYIFSVMFTDLFRDLQEKNPEMEYDYFGRMDLTFFSLFQLMTLDDWVSVARQSMAVYAWAWMPFTAYVVISAFVIFNLIIAVICDAVAALDDDNQDKLYGRYLDMNNDESLHADEIIDVKEQLHYLESEMDKMQRMQEETVKLVKLLLDEKTASPGRKRSNGAPMARGISRVSITAEPTNNSGREFIAKKRAGRTLSASLEKEATDLKKIEDGDP
mmetsp:Transcript_781/g.1226  ORF Transcript_781/g.1226 Transcript_781/m.1226 type:complete len:562 (+) Transcript_781:2-1687(+)